MNLNFLAVIVNKKLNNHTVSETWNPEPEGVDCMPNFASVFVDPFWTALYCQKEVGQHPAGHLEGVCSVFKIQERIHPIDASSMQKFSWPRKHKRETYSVCNSIKFHFFKVSYDIVDAQVFQDNSQPEQRREFCFSSSIPLIHNNSQSDVYGLFNYNTHDQYCNTLDDFRLVVINLAQPISIPKEITLLPISGPSPTHHSEVLKLGAWIANTLSVLCPEVKSSFLNPRTMCRDYCNTLLFQDLQSLFDVKGTSLPPTLACYTLCNALIVSNISPESFCTSTHKLTVFLEPDFDLRLILRIFRDTIAGMSMCLHEGKYWSDTSLGQTVEDQPFPLSFLPGCRIFQKDDCEGRISQTQEMVKLLKCMFQASEVQGLDAFINSILDIPPDVSRLALKRKTLGCIIQSCINLGRLLHENKLQVHTVVGDVCFAAFKAEMIDAKTEEVSGHSFGVIKFDDGKQYACSILEGTGWERSQIPSDRPVLKSEVMLVKSLSQNMKQQGRQLTVCGQLPPKKENQVYQRMCLGNKCIFFSMPTSKTPPQYGPGLELFRYKVYAHPHQNADSQGVLQISTGDFLNQMAQMEQHTLSKSKKKSFLWDITNPNIARAVEGAGNMAQIYQNIEARMPHIRRCLATPSKTESDFKNLMKSWATINQLSIPSVSEPFSKGVLFTIPNTAHENVFPSQDDCNQNTICDLLKVEQGSPLSDAMTNCQWHSHGFMHSIIFKFSNPTLQ